MMFDIEDHYPDYFEDEDRELDNKYTLLVLNFERVIQESKKAWLVEFPMDDELNNVTCWLPKSQCKVRLQDKKIQVPQWLVEENDLEDYQDAE
jgi:phosphoribosylaminoimidazole carboxylase (NCAIR synthetase)